MSREARHMTTAARVFVDTARCYHGRISEIRGVAQKRGMLQCCGFTRGHRAARYSDYTSIIPAGKDYIATTRPRADEKYPYSNRGFIILYSYPYASTT